MQRRPFWKSLKKVKPIHETMHLYIDSSIMRNFDYVSLGNFKTHTLPETKQLAWAGLLVWGKVLQHFTTQFVPWQGGLLGSLPHSFSQYRTEMEWCQGGTDGPPVIFFEGAHTKDPSGRSILIGISGKIALQWSVTTQIPASKPPDNDQQHVKIICLQTFTDIRLLSPI